VAERTGAYDADTLFMLRDIALELGKLDEARALESDLQTYHGLDPNGVIAAYGRAMLDRDLVSAAEALDRLVSLPMEGEAGEDVSAHYSPSILHGRAEIAMAQGEVDRAAEILRGIAASDPHATSVWPALAWLALQTGRMADARTWAIEGLIYCSAEEVIDDLRIAVPDSLKDVEKPTRLLRRAETAHLLVVLGYVALSTGGTDEALKYCGKALEMNPYNEDAFLLKARALELSGDTEEAVHVVVQGLRTAPEDDGLAMRHVILARHAPGTLGPTDPDPDSVLEDLLEECRGRHEMFPADPESAYMLARLFMLSGEEGAGELLEYAYKTEPHMTAYSLCYAAHLAETGDLEGALGVVESAGLAPDLLWLYDSYYRVGETESKAFLDFTDRVWDRMDPERRFAPVLDPLRNAAEVACGIESP
jgi:tetratricopeptide (TPR) repeat protein